MDGGEKVAGLGGLALAVPETGEAGCGAEFPGLGILRAGDLNGIPKTRFRLSPRPQSILALARIFP